MDETLPISGALLDYFQKAATERIIARLTSGTLNADAVALAEAELARRGFTVRAFEPVPVASDALQLEPMTRAPRLPADWTFASDEDVRPSPDDREPVVDAPSIGDEIRRADSLRKTLWVVGVGLLVLIFGGAAFLLWVLSGVADNFH